MPSITLRAAVPLALVLAAAQPALAAKPLAVTVTATEVTIRNAKEKRRDEIAAALRTASTEEAHYYDQALRPATLRIQVEKVGFKSAGKAALGMVPLVGMFAGANRNVMKGRVSLVDAVSGKPIAQWKIECDDDTDFSGSDAALALGKVGLSFLPFGSLIESAIDVAEGASSKRDRAEQMLTRGFVMLSYKKAYGDKLYKSFSRQRKAAFELARAEKKAALAPVSTPTPSPSPAASDAATPIDPVPAPAPAA
jgi:hypothetical protein